MIDERNKLVFPPIKKKRTALPIVDTGEKTCCKRSRGMRFKIFKNLKFL